MSGDADAKEGADTAVPEVAPISPVSPSPRGVSSPRNHGIPVLQHSPYGSGGGRRDRSASFQGIVASNAAGTPIVSSRLALGHASPNVGSSRYSSHSAGASPVPNFTGAFSTLPPAAPFLPNLVSSSAIPPVANSHLHDVHVKVVVDAAMQQEKARAEELQALEMDMDVDELKRALKKERAHSSRLAVDLATLRSAAVQSQADAEVHEEGRINGLMRRLEGLQQEKGRIIFELEREEEMLTNTLQKKLNEVRREKALLEQQIEREQLSHSELVSRLQNMAIGNSAASSVHVTDATAEGAAVIRE
uniref:Uncharacterized protein n=1 Tax=Attheya septentrionalis TaxID=420275 RepID=A0A7S2URH4_9STRA|mmetsp:Transcript_9349/g.16952  ORF Transcript_9349/g.16952 Transcript_9349/m.16952 type:complete len:304 (+) Transcript_9349:183-1094(+)